MTAIKPTSIKLPADVAHAVTEAAEAAGLTRNAWLVAAVRAALSGEVTTEVTTAQNGADLAARVSEVERQLAELKQQTPPPRMYSGILRGEAVPVAEPEAPATTAPATKGSASHSPEAVARIIELTLQGVSPGGIALRLNEEGYQPAKADKFKEYIVKRVLTAHNYREQRLAAGLKL